MSVTASLHAPYKVIAHSEQDGLLIDHFETKAEADAFARDVSEEGYTTMVCLVIRRCPSPALPARDAVAAPGIDYPASLTRPLLAPRRPAA